MQNWKTTTSGILTALVAVITSVVLPLLDGQDLNGESLITAIVSIITAVGLICAKDSGNGAGGGPPQQSTKILKTMGKNFCLLSLLCLSIIKFWGDSTIRVVRVSGHDTQRALTTNERPFGKGGDHE